MKEEEQADDETLGLGTWKHCLPSCWTKRNYNSKRDKDGVILAILFGINFLKDSFQQPLHV
jgi:hypothetical protein